MDGVRCPVCGSARLTDHRDLQECRACTHLFQWPATITARYDAAYVAKYAGYPLTEISYLRVGLLKAFVSKGRLLDVGHCRGDFVRAAQRAGFDAWGYDVHGIDVGVPTVPKLCNGQPWDVVTFFDSLEHFDRLESARALGSLAKWIVVACPCRPASFPAVRDWRHYRPGEHLHYFSRQSLGRLFTRRALVLETNAEDAVRGQRGSATNIATYIFRK